MVVVRDREIDGRWKRSENESIQMKINFSRFRESITLRLGWAGSLGRRRFLHFDGGFCCGGGFGRRPVALVAIATAVGELRRFGGRRGRRRRRCRLRRCCCGRCGGRGSRLESRVVVGVCRGRVCLGRRRRRVVQVHVVHRLDVGVGVGEVGVQVEGHFVHDLRGGLFVGADGGRLVLVVVIAGVERGGGSLGGEDGGLLLLLVLLVELVLEHSRALGLVLVAAVEALAVDEAEAGPLHADLLGRLLDVAHHLDAGRDGAARREARLDRQPLLGDLLDDWDRLTAASARRRYLVALGGRRLRGRTGLIGRSVARLSARTARRRSCRRRRRLLARLLLVVVVVIVHVLVLVVNAIRSFLDFDARCLQNGRSFIHCCAYVHENSIRKMRRTCDKQRKRQIDRIRDDFSFGIHPFFFGGKCFGFADRRRHSK